MAGATLREPYRGGSQLAVPFPSTDRDDDTDGPISRPIDDGPDQAAADDVEPDSDDDGSDAPSSARTSSAKGGGRGRRLLAARANDVSGALFAVLAWSWIVLPLVQGGPGRVRDVWRAKWLNKDSEGKWLG